MTFEWDTVKNSSNLAKHGIDFEDAVKIFQGPVLEKEDTRKQYGESRFVAFGLAVGRQLVVVYTQRGEHRRVISARRANAREQKAYREAYLKK